MNKTFLILAILFLTAVFNISANAQDASSPYPPQDDVDQNVEIVKKQQPEPPRNCTQKEGVTSIRVAFDKSAKVTEVEVVKSSGCREFDDNSKQAAKRIKFKPAKKKGEAVTVYKVVQYSYRRY